MPRVSSADIAREAQVSRATVSYVLNDRPGRRISEATRQRILETAQMLGYTPNPTAMTLRTGQSRVVLLREDVHLPEAGQEVLPLGSTAGMLRDEVARQVRQWGFTLISFGTGFPLSEVLAHLAPSLVLAPAGLSEEDRQALELTSTPWYEGPAERRPALSLMNESSARAQVAHLLAQGHRRVVYLAPGLPQLVDIARERTDLFLVACADAGLECVDQLSLNGLDDEAAEFCAATLIAWRRRGVTAVACFDDLLAGVALRALRIAGLQAPRDLAIIGLDDEPMSQLLEPPLTTVRLDMVRFGNYLAQCGRAILDGSPLPPTPNDLTPIVIRSTT